MNKSHPNTYGAGPERYVFTVSELTDKLKSLLEETFALVWITGEISNFRVPSSGHCYFTLKDSEAQISAVMFRNQARTLKFTPEDGMKITGFGRISVYAPRGAYQVILEYLEPAGIGALQAAFEQLKAKLAQEGLFDPARKQPIPYLPRKICLITSPTGSVVHDMIRIIHRRYENADIEIIPAKVQGEGAAEEIVCALKLLNDRNLADVAILARGGGSLEDLSAFNSEIVARALFASRIPVISAVGHETDFTISDFVADLRAPTPSAAAELTVPVKQDLIIRQRQLQNQLACRTRAILDRQVLSLSRLARRLVHPRKRLDDLRLRLDDYSMRLLRQLRSLIRQKSEKLLWCTRRLNAMNPLIQIRNRQADITRMQDLLISRFYAGMESKRRRVSELTDRLHAIGPAAVLDRGYSIARTVEDKRVIRAAADVLVGQSIEIVLSSGLLICRVEGKDNHGKENI